MENIFNEIAIKKKQKHQQQANKLFPKITNGFEHTAGNSHQISTL